MTAKPETAAEVLAEMRNSAWAYADNWTDRLERALSAQGEAVAWVDSGALALFLNGPTFSGENFPITMRHAKAVGDVPLYAHPASPTELTRENEASLMLAIAEFIAASATPEDPRLAVADAISRHLGLGWPSASHPAPARVTEEVRALLERALPFLRDEAGKYDDDGSNEPLELTREIEAALEDGRHG